MREVRTKILKMLACFSLAGGLAQVCALEFPVMNSGQSLVGRVQFVQVGPEDNLTKIARRYDIAYQKLIAANPGLSNSVPVGTVITIPTRFILPGVLRKGIVINTAEYTLYYFNAVTHRVSIYPIGIGRQDWVTPVGQWKIAQKQEHPYWIAPDSIMKYREENGDPVEKVTLPGPDNPLGDYAMRLTQYNYLIHGTNDPDGVGHRSSAGCIRMYPEDIDNLFHQVPVGTPVHIVNWPYKFGILANRVLIEAVPPLEEERDQYQALDTVLPSMLLAQLPKSTAKVDWSRVVQWAQKEFPVPYAVGVVEAQDK